MLRTFIFTLALLGTFSQGFSFCGFYVAQADVSLYNQASQVILARSGNTTTITMASDFQGEVKDFAMVVPVPVVIQKDQIRIVDASIFDKLDAYSSPRLVEYRDDNPCGNHGDGHGDMLAYQAAEAKGSQGTSARQNEALGIDIEARYSVGEYDIIVLSAKESNGLKIWLKANGYKIPKQAERVLAPYIKNKVKFFVAKVNLRAYASQELTDLHPLQMTFSSEKFMLPIRLGMANAIDDQDLIVYAFSPIGRVEATNYRTIDIPTDRKIPTFVAENFGDFYAAVFEHTWEKAGKDVVVSEYGWDISSSNYLKCDPCAGDPPLFADLNEAGAFWLKNQKVGGADYQGDVYITRLHVRYNEETFPQDLAFQATPNRNNFQARYVMQQPAEGNLDCDKAKDYIKKLIKRRTDELTEMASLTGWDKAKYQDYVETYERYLDGEDVSPASGIARTVPGEKAPQEPGIPGYAYALMLLAVVALGGAVYYGLKNKNDRIA